MKSEWYKSMEGKPVATTMFKDNDFDLVKRGNDIEVFEGIVDKGGISIGIVKDVNLSDTEDDDYFDSQEKKVWDFIRTKGY